MLKDYREIVKQLGAVGVDHVNLAVKAETLRLRCMEGIQQEKVSNRAEEGFVTVTEVYPDVAAKCIDLQFKILQDASDRIQDVTEESGLDLTINITSLDG